jgi:hypothetical protein
VREKWSILDDRVVTIPGAGTQWGIWLARPHGSNDEKSRTFC